MTTIITPPVVTSGSFTVFDDLADSLLDAIKGKFECIGTESSILGKFDLVIECEFLHTRLRSELASELTKVRRALSVSYGSPAKTKAYKDREVDLLALNSRLNEMRDDFNCIQRSIYAKNLSKI